MNNAGGADRAGTRESISALPATCARKVAALRALQLGILLQQQNALEYRAGRSSLKTVLIGGLEQLVRVSGIAH